MLIDHLGRPFQGTEKEHAVVVGWSKFDHVVMKLSAVPDRRTYPHRDPAPVVKRLTEAFGADRLMYGGGYGAKATGESYRAERERIRRLARTPVGRRPGQGVRRHGGEAVRVRGWLILSAAGLCTPAGDLVDCEAAIGSRRGALDSSGGEDCARA